MEDETAEDGTAAHIKISELKIVLKYNITEP